MWENLYNPEKSPQKSAFFSDYIVLFLSLSYPYKGKYCGRFFLWSIWKVFANAVEGFYFKCRLKNLKGFGNFKLHMCHTNFRTLCLPC